MQRVLFFLFQAVLFSIDLVVAHEQHMLSTPGAYFHGHANAKVFLPYRYTRFPKEFSSGWVGYIRNDANYSTRQFYDLGFINVTSFYPRQKDPVFFNADANAVPMISVVDTMTQVGHWTELPCSFGTFRTFIAGTFTGNAIGAGIMNIDNAYASWAYNNHELLVGQYLNPMRFEYNAPRVISYTFGAPIASRGLNPQLAYSYTDAGITTTLCAYGQMLYCTRGPVFENTGLITDALTLYQQWGLIPSTNLKIIYDDCKRLKVAAAFDVKSIKPYIASKPAEEPLSIPFINNNRVTSWVVSLFGRLTGAHAELTSQVMYGSNAMDMLTFGGYAFAQIGIPDGNTDNPTTYTPLYFVSAWSSINFGNLSNKWLPGFFIGYGKNLGTKTLLENATNLFPTGPIVYLLGTGNSVSGFSPVVKSLSSLLRISPRLWYAPQEHILIGVEIETSKASYGFINQCGQAIREPETVRMIRSTFSTQFSF